MRVESRAKSLNHPCYRFCFCIYLYGVYDCRRSRAAKQSVGLLLLGEGVPISRRSLRTASLGVVNPPRGKLVREWDYSAEATAPIVLKQGEEMGRFLLGSTVVMLFPKGPLHFNPDWAPGRSIRLGEAMANYV